MSTMDHLNGMLDADRALYERILDTPGFAYHFGRLSQLATAADELLTVAKKARK